MATPSFALYLLFFIFRIAVQRHQQGRNKILQQMLFSKKFSKIYAL